MKKQFYLVKLTDSSLFLDEAIPLDAIMREDFPELYQLDIERVALIWSGDLTKPRTREDRKIYDKHIEKMNEAYDRYYIPKYLIAYGTDKEAFEIATHARITSAYPAALGVRAVPKEEAVNYLLNTNYNERVINFFKKIGILDETKSVPSYDDLLSELDVEEIEVIGQIDGLYDGKPISGKFSGRVRIKKDM